MPIPNASEWELKCQREGTTSLTTLFHMEPSPRALRFVPNYFLPLFGWKHSEAGISYPENELSFRQTINGESRTDRGFMVVIDWDDKKVLVSFDSATVDPRHESWLENVNEHRGMGELEPQPYWGFTDLEYRAGTKLNNAFYVQAKVKREDGKEYFYYNRISILKDFKVENFITALVDGNVLIDFDARTGHNHGTKFRVRQNALPSLYSEIIEVD